MTMFDFIVTSRNAMRFTTAASALALGAMLGAAPAGAAACKFDPIGPINAETGVEPMLRIDGVCTDPDYNESTFVIDKTEQLTFQVPNGPLIPYTEVSGHFPARRTLEQLPPPIRQSPTTIQQNYVFRFPAKEYWRNRSMLQQHPTGGGQVDRQMAFTNGAFTVNWMSASQPNHVASHRHQAAANQVAKAYANKHYNNTARIYSYMWGCSGGGIVGMAGAENVTGIWDGVQPQCLGPTGVATYHSFHWQAHYTAAIPEAKRKAIADAAAPGGSGDIYAGLNEEEKAVLNEFISAGYPLQIIGNHFTALDLPLVDPVDIRVADPTYEDDFWSKPGYAGSNPPNYLKAAMIDGWATITGITRDAAGAPTALQFDPATIPPAGSVGDAYLEYWVYGSDGKTRLIDPKRPLGHFTENKRRFSLQGKLDRATGALALTGLIPERRGPGTPIVNSPVLLNALKVGDKVRINNRFILAMYYYPRHSNIPGSRSHDQYRNAEGSSKYPQRENLSILSHANYRTMGGRIETGDIKTKTMIMEGMGDNLSWPLFNASYAEQVQRAIGKEKAEQMMRFYLHDNGNHSTGGGEPGIFQQSIQDLMAWAERGIAPPRSTQYTIRNGQVIAAPRAADRHGLQPVMTLTANGAARAVVGVGQPVNLAAVIEMPPKTGPVVQYNWTVDGTAEAPTNLTSTQPQVNVTRTMTFDKPGTHVVRLIVHGQRDGLLDPPNRTLVRNYKDVRVVVGDAAGGGSERRK
jgi:hypothetical protein